MTALAVTRVINTCVVIEIGGHSVLTDPYFTPHRFFRTNETIGLDPATLVPLTAVLGGHRAFDHWQPKSMRAYPHRSTTPVYTASAGMSTAARRAGFVNVERLKWYSRRDLAPGLTVTCVPSQRTFGMVSNSYLLQTPDVVVLVGTEALDQRAIAGIAETYEVDVAVLPIDGATFLGKQLVMNAAGALQATRTLGARVLVPIHHSERPVRGLLRCPSSLDELMALAADEPRVSVVNAGTGSRVLIDVGSPIGPFGTEAGG